MRRFLAVSAVLVAAAASVAVYRHQGRRDPEFKLVRIERGRIVETAVATGALRPRREVTVKSKIPGLVHTRFHEVGDAVAAGEPLFEIIPDPTPLERTEARREIQIARNIYDEARKRHQRLQALLTDGVVARQELDSAEKDMRDAQLRLGLAEERLALVERGQVTTQGLKVESILLAPVTGTVLELLVSQGDPVVPLTSYQAGTALATLADMSALVFKGTVDETDVGKLREGMAARVRVGALPDVAVEGSISKIAPKSRTQEGATLFDVDIDVAPAGPEVLRAGYSATAEIVVREKAGVLVVPERLVDFGGGRTTVEVPGGKDGSPVKREVRLGLSDAFQAEVLSGLAEGDLVVERSVPRVP